MAETSQGGSTAAEPNKPAATTSSPSGNASDTSVTFVADPNQGGASSIAFDADDSLEKSTGAVPSLESATPSGGSDSAAPSSSDAAPEGGIWSGVQTLKEGGAKLTQQATDSARNYAVDTKDRVTDALDDFARIVRDAADEVDKRLGQQFGDYARTAAEAVAGFAESVKAKDVDDLVDDARSLVRKSPGIAIGTAAALGFALARVVKAGRAGTGDADDRAGSDAA